MVKNTVVVRDLFKYACGFVLESNRYPPDEAASFYLPLSNSTSCRPTGIRNAQF